MNIECPRLTSQPLLRVRPVLGKAEGAGTNWHGHVSAVSVAPQFRRLGIARVLMDELERISERV